MYLCSVCGVCSKSGQTRQTHVIYREVPVGTQTHKVRDADGNTRTMSVRTPPRKTIDREIDVCKDCKGYLDEGMSISQVALLVTKIREEEQERLEEVNGAKKRKQSTRDDWTNGATSLHGAAKTK